MTQLLSMGFINGVINVGTIVKPTIANSPPWGHDPINTKWVIGATTVLLTFRTTCELTKKLRAGDVVYSTEFM